MRCFQHGGSPASARPGPTPRPLPGPSVGPEPRPMFYDPDPWADATNLFRDEPIRPSDPVAAAPVSGPDDDELEVPDFLVPGFSAEPVPPAVEAPPPTVLGGVLGPELWTRCRAEWSAGHCAQLARVARTMDGLAPAATTSIKSTAGASLRWLGVTRERDELAVQVSEAIGKPDDVSASNSARTVRLYGAALCAALGLSLRRCSCHRDLQRDVSPELIELGLAGLAERLI
jgi:hypothetical protein